MPKKKLTQAERVKREAERRKKNRQSSVQQRVEEYLKLNKRNRARQHPRNEEREFWALYDQEMGNA